MIPFAKGHGLGNDYLVVNEADLPGPLTEAAIVKICDRNWGVGSDGILLLAPSARADFGLRIFNPDGSEAEKSGNGLRIFAKYLWDHGHAKGADLHRGDPGRARRVRVPRPRLAASTSSPWRWAAPPSGPPTFPWTSPAAEAVAVPLGPVRGAGPHGDRGLGGESALRRVPGAARRGRGPAPRPAHRAPRAPFPSARTCSSPACTDATTSRS